MKFEHIPVKLPLEYDPYEEDCCGSFSADKLIVTENHPNNAIIITIQEFRSGIGNEFQIFAVGPNGQKSKVLCAYMDDDGELNFYLKE